MIKLLENQLTFNDESKSKHTDHSIGQSSSVNSANRSIPSELYSLSASNSMTSFDKYPELFQLIDANLAQQQQQPHDRDSIRLNQKQPRTFVSLQELTVVERLGSEAFIKILGAHVDRVDDQGFGFVISEYFAPTDSMLLLFSDDAEVRESTLFSYLCNLVD